MQTMLERKKDLCVACYLRNRDPCRPSDSEGKSKFPCQFCKRRGLDGCRAVTEQDILDQRQQRRENHRQYAQNAASPLSVLAKTVDEFKDVSAEPEEDEQEPPEKKKKGPKTFTRTKYGKRNILTEDKKRALEKRIDELRKPCKHCREMRGQETGTSDCIGNPCKWCVEAGHACTKKPLSKAERLKWLTALARLPADAKFLPRRKRCLQCNLLNGPSARVCEQRPKGTKCHRCKKFGIECTPDNVGTQGKALDKGVVSSGVYHKAETYIRHGLKRKWVRDEKQKVGAPKEPPLKRRRAEGGAGGTSVPP